MRNILFLSIGFFIFASCARPSTNEDKSTAKSSIIKASSIDVYTDCDIKIERDGVEAKLLKIPSTDPIEIAAPQGSEPGTVFVRGIQLSIYDPSQADIERIRGENQVNYTMTCRNEAGSVSYQGGTNDDSFFSFEQFLVNYNNAIAQQNNQTITAQPSVPAVATYTDCDINIERNGAEAKLLKFPSIDPIEITSPQGSEPGTAFVRGTQLSIYDPSQADMQLIRGENQVNYTMTCRNEAGSVSYQGGTNDDSFFSLEQFLVNYNNAIAQQNNQTITAQPNIPSNAEFFTSCSFAVHHKDDLTGSRDYVASLFDVQLVRPEGNQAGTMFFQSRSLAIYNVLPETLPQLQDKNVQYVLNCQQSNGANLAFYGAIDGADFASFRNAIDPFIQALPPVTPAEQLPGTAELPTPFNPTP